MRHVLLAVLVLGAAGPVLCQGMNADPEAQALRARFRAMTVAGTALADDLNAPRERSITGPITLGRSPGGDGEAAVYPETRDNAIHIYYGVVLPRRGHLALDFLLPPQRPADHNFMTLVSAGTAGNTKFMLRVTGELRPFVSILTKRENIQLTGDPLVLGQWHHLDWWYAPEGSVLAMDDVIHDYSTDFCVPYAVEVGEAFWLGDQPWWDAGGRKGVFYPLDSFVGSLDNLCLESLK
ncbi:MAG: hypothetical protein KKI08_14370 [Armatimonadetes bacterium]|nr:hypothetical protein [Armatimonadota bacterium]